MPSTPILHVSYDFMRLADNKVDSFTGGIIANTYGKSAFPEPPIKQGDLSTGLQTYTDALAAMVDAGPSATAAKNAAKAALLGLLHQVAHYVQDNCGNDLATLLSSGFHAASNNRTQTILPQANIKKALTAATGTLYVESATMANAKSWQARWKPEGAPDSAYQLATTLKAVRKMTITGLPSLTRVTIQTRGVGGSTGYGGWSEAVTQAVI